MIGQTISHYRITARLGEGGMGVVYRAEDLRLDRPVAIKLLNPQLSQDPNARARLLREAKAASALQHPNICSVFEIDDTEDGQLFMVMPCYEGESLQQRLARGPVELDEALELGWQISSALAATHAKGIVHRDLKPGNIMLTHQGQQAVLMDFGLARPDDATQMTRTGAAMGTLAYMSPEQVRGEHVNERADLWALGVVLYELTTGQRPFKGDGEAPILESILHTDPEPASAVRPGVPPALAAMIERLLEKSPEKRESDAGAVTRLLEEHQRAIAERGPGPDAPIRWRLRHWLHRHRRLLRATAATLLVLIALAAWQLWPTGGPLINSLAVLPFSDLSADGDQEWFCDAITVGLIQALGEAGIPGVVSRTSMLRYRDTDKSLPEISAELGADALVESSIRQIGDRIRISSRLVMGENEDQLWAESFERELKDILQWHAEIAQIIADRVQLAIDPETRTRLETPSEVDPEAYRLYLRAKQALYGGITAKSDTSGWDGIKKRLEEALALDPTFAKAWAALAEWNVRSLHSLEPDVENLVAAARAALSRAFEIDPDLQEAFVTQAHLQWEHEWKQEEAAESFRRAQELNPSDSYVLTVYAYYSMVNRRFVKSAEACLKACRLDPYSQFAFNVSREPLRRAGYFTELLELMDVSVERFPEMAQAPDIVAVWRAYALHGLKRSDEAVALLKELPSTSLARNGVLMEILMEMGQTEEAQAVFDDALTHFPEEIRDPLIMALTHSFLGNRDEALDYFSRVGDLHGAAAIEGALVPLRLGDLDRCFELLETAYEDRCILLPRINYRREFYDPLHENHRFKDLIERMGLASEG